MGIKGVNATLLGSLEIEEMLVREVTGRSLLTSLQTNLVHTSFWKRTDKVMALGSHHWGWQQGLL